MKTFLTIYFPLLVAVVVAYILADKETIFLLFLKDKLQVELKNSKSGPYILVYYPVKFFGKQYKITVTKRRPKP